MSLPRLSCETLESFCAEVMRDASIGPLKNIPEKMQEELKESNPWLYTFLEVMTKKLEGDSRVSYVCGFMACYAMLNRQSEVDSLE